MYLKNLMTAAVAAMGLSFGASSASATTVDLGFAVDDSGSVSASDFQLAIDGLAGALAQVPISGPTQYRISVVAFSGSTSTRTEVPVTVIDSQAALDSVISGVENISRIAGSTAIGTAIELLTQNFLDAGGLGDTTILNVTTDGDNNSGIAVSTAAANAAAAGVDALSFEAVGSPDTSALLDVAFPGTPVLITDAADLPDDVLSTSFVFQVDSFADFDAAISAKIEQIIDDTGGGDPNVVPLPAGLPLLVVGLGALGLMRRRIA